MEANPPPFSRPLELKSVLIKCPRSQLPIRTGIATSANSDLGRYQSQTLKCPICGETHTWSGSDAFFE